MSTDPQASPKDNILTKQALYDKMAALAQASGMDVNGEVKALLAPLLDGRASYEEHRAMLKAMREDNKP